MVSLTDGVDVGCSEIVVLMFSEYEALIEKMLNSAMIKSFLFIII